MTNCFVHSIQIREALNYSSIQLDSAGMKQKIHQQIKPSGRKDCH